MKVAVIDYGAGNLFSLLSALTHLEFDIDVVDTAFEFGKNYDAVVLPGVGAFQAGMKELDRRGLIPLLRTHAAQGRRLVGICLGAQLLLERGTEFGVTEGLGVIPGTVEALSLRGFTTPVVGWAPILWQRYPFGGAANQWMYFVHSFEMVVGAKTAVLATTKQGESVYSAALQMGSTIGFQFHPEKSGREGLKLLKDALTKEFGT